VLIVEDNPAELRPLCSAVEGDGFRVTGCGSAAEALHHGRQQRFSVAVVDYHVLSASGTQLLEQLRVLDDQIRVIIYTGEASYDSIKEALNLGVFAYLEKLSSPGELLPHVHRACLDRVDRYAQDLEQAVAFRVEDLARSNRDLEEFASVVAHDLRTPLLTISGFCQLISDEYGDRLDENARDYLSQIAAGVGRMDSLIEGILEYSRAGRSAAPLRRVNMQSVLDVEPLMNVVGDQTQLVQLFQNLLGNAIKFHRDEPPQIRVSAASIENAWRFAVEDNGIGIDEEHFEQVFRTFKRLHGCEYPGTGIGLSVCRKIVERHRGRIWLASTVGQGTTFYFTISNQPPDVQIGD
jgi:signal transduction histidine kinase